MVTLSFLGTCVPALASTNESSLEKQLADLEASFDGKIGVYAVDTANNQKIQHRANERFPTQSTFKTIAASAILKQSMKNPQLLQEKMTYSKQNLVFWSPITEKNSSDSMTIFDLTAASMMYSDNTATNLIVEKLGGPQAVTAFARSIGDTTFRNDNREPDLNSNPSNPQDSSTPAAMNQSLQKLALGNVLGNSQREQLVTWMKGNTTGDARIRAGIPKGWIVADKTGASNDYGVSNDIGLIWAPHCSPLVVTIYTIHNKKDTSRRDDIVASTMRILVNEFAKTNSCIKNNLKD